MRIIISGISGFLGAYAARYLKSSHEIAGIVGPSGDRPVQDIKIYEGNKLKEIGRADAILMCHAAVSSGTIKSDGEKLFKANVLFTQQILEAFPDAYLLYISSVSIFKSNPEQIINEDSAINPLSEYAISKLWGETITATSQNYGILRLSSLYGIGMKENTIIPNYVNQALQFGKVEVWGNGERKQNYFSAKDAAVYAQRMIESKSNGLFLGVSSKETSNIELAEIIAASANAKIVFKGEDISSSVKYDNSQTRIRLKIDSEMQLSTELKEYIDWKRKQF